MATCEGLMNAKMKMSQCCLNFILSCCWEICFTSRTDIKCFSCHFYIWKSTGSRLEKECFGTHGGHGKDDRERPCCWVALLKGRFLWTTPLSAEGDSAARRISLGNLPWESIISLDDQAVGGAKLYVRNYKLHHLSASCPCLCTSHPLTDEIGPTGHCWIHGSNSLSLSQLSKILLLFLPLSLPFLSLLLGPISVLINCLWM